MELFELGDLLRFKPGNHSSPSPGIDGTASLVVVTRLLPASRRFFYGRACSTWEEHLWNCNQFDLVSRGPQ